MHSVTTIARAVPLRVMAVTFFVLLEVHAADTAWSSLIQQSATSVNVPTTGTMPLLRPGERVQLAVTGLSQQVAARRRTRGHLRAAVAGPLNAVALSGFLVASPRRCRRAERSSELLCDAAAVVDYRRLKPRLRLAEHARNPPLRCSLSVIASRTISPGTAPAPQVLVCVLPLCPAGSSDQRRARVATTKRCFQLRAPSRRIRQSPHPTSSGISTTVSSAHLPFTGTAKLTDDTNNHRMISGFLPSSNPNSESTDQCRWDVSKRSFSA